MAFYQRKLVFDFKLPSVDGWDPTGVLDSLLDFARIINKLCMQPIASIVSAVRGSVNFPKRQKLYSLNMFIGGLPKYRHMAE